MHLYHEVQSTYSALEDKILPLKTFLLAFNVQILNWKRAKLRQILT